MRQQRMGMALAWTLVGVVSILLALNTQQDELKAQAVARYAASQTEALQMAWSQWDGQAPLPSDPWRLLPEDARAGRALVRALLATSSPEARQLLEQLGRTAYPLLSWYQDFPPTQMLEAELTLLALALLPWPGLHPYLEPGLESRALLLSPVLAREALRRCAFRCVGLEPEDEQETLALLVSAMEGEGNGPDGSYMGQEAVLPALAAAAVLSRGFPEVLPLLDARKERGTGTRLGDLLALQVASRTVAVSTRRAVLQRALTGKSPGLQLVGALEALRSGNASQADALRVLQEQDSPPGLAILAAWVEQALTPGTRLGKR